MPQTGNRDSASPLAKNRIAALKSPPTLHNGWTMAEPTSLPPDIVALSFEDALAELERIVRQLEEGRGKLDESIHSYERGTALKRHCEAKLREAQAKVDRITVAADGTIGTEPARIE